MTMATGGGGAPRQSTKGLSKLNPRSAEFTSSFVPFEQARQVPLQFSPQMQQQQQHYSRRPPQPPPYPYRPFSPYDVDSPNQGPSPSTASTSANGFPPYPNGPAPWSPPPPALRSPYYSPPLLPLMANSPPLLPFIHHSFIHASPPPPLPPPHLGFYHHPGTSSHPSSASSSIVAASYPPPGVPFPHPCGPPITTFTQGPNSTRPRSLLRSKKSRPLPKDAPPLSFGPNLLMRSGLSPSSLSLSASSSTHAPPKKDPVDAVVKTPTQASPGTSTSALPTKESADADAPPPPSALRTILPSLLRADKDQVAAASTTATVASSSAPSSPILTPSSAATTATTFDSPSPASASIGPSNPASFASPPLSTTPTSSSTPTTPAPASSAPLSTPSSPPALFPPTPSYSSTSGPVPPPPTTTLAAPPKKSWADLVRSPTSSATALPSAILSLSPRSVSLQDSHLSSIPPLNPDQSLKKTLSALPLTLPAPSIVPRGLINNGNLCFANAILQLLVHTGPFWHLLDLLKRETRVGNGMKAGRMGSLDAMVIFIEEFRPSSLPTLVRHSRQKSSNSTPLPIPNAATTPSASSSDFPPPHPDPFVPEQVYESLKPNKRFDAMRRGHQEDAEEFLGFFLDTIHEEILSVLDELEKRGKNGVPRAGINGIVNGNGEANGTADAEDGAEWLEVGSKGKTATTRTTETRESPVTAIFGGHVRSVLRCPGQKDSITLEPYQRLQLDIQPDSVRTIEDALRNLTLPETLPDFQSRPGHRADATKQVFLESFPPVLILHLKRFLYDNVGGVQKSGKIIGYGTELVIEEELIAPSKRSGKKIVYELYGVVLHHGGSALGGHYTVSLRQDASWINVDDTHIRPLDPSEVAVSVPSKSASAQYSSEGATAYLLAYRLVAA